MIESAIIIVWITCGILHYGLWVDYFQRKYPMLAEENHVSDRVFGAVFAFFGPIALLATIITLSPRGWRL